MLWTGHRGDVYVGAHGMTGDLKLSLHASGDWRHAFSREHYKAPHPSAPPRRRRVIKRWRRPSEFTRGFTRAFQILVPDEHITTPQDEAIHALKVDWIPRPGREREAYISGILGPQDATGWPGRNAMGTELVLQHDLGNGERLWVVWHAEDIRPVREQALKKVSSRLRQELAGEPELHLANPVHRVFTIGVEHGTGVITDLSVPVLMGRC